MRATILTAIISLMYSFAGSPGLSAEAPSFSPARPNDFRTGERTVEDRLDLLEEQIRSLMERIDLIQRRAAVANGGESRSSGTDAGSDPATTLERLKRLENTTNGIYNRLEQISRKAEETKPRPRPDAPAVLPQPAQGRLVVQNWTEFSHYLSVNGTLYLVRPGRAEISVAHQMVEVYLPGRELPKLLGMSFWRWTGRDYEMRVEIKY